VTAPPIDTQRLQDRIEELEQLLGMAPTLPRPWRLTPREARLFGLLMKHAVLSADFIIAAIWGGDAGTSDKSLEVLVFKLRRKLAPAGIVINTEWSTGYYIAADHKRLARDLIAVHEQVAA
jgi:DNA-binding response OmpR family regulator